MSAKFEWVYLLRAGNSDRWKVGFTTHLLGRVGRISTLSCYPISTILTYPSQNAIEEEKYWHERLAPYRTHKEWYHLYPKDVLDSTLQAFMERAEREGSVGRESKLPPVVAPVRNKAADDPLELDSSIWQL